MAHRISAMTKAVELLTPIRSSISQAGTGSLPGEVDWSKLRRLDFQEAMRSREAYSSRIQQHLGCFQIEAFSSNVSASPFQRKLPLLQTKLIWTT